ISTKNKEATLLIDGKIKKTIMMNAIAFKNNNGEVYSALGVYSDITEKKILEAKLLQSEKLSSLGTMAAGIAHELNNPLQGIAGFSELLLNEKCNEKQMEKIKLINEQAERASSIIKDLLIFSRQKAEEQKPSNINKLIEQAVKMVSYGFKNHQIDIELNLPSDIPIIDVYENRIVQIFINILKNSYQNMIVHNPKGKITIKTSVENKTPFLKIKSDCKKVLKISIEDEGSGIERAVINKIFDPFFSTTESKENIGLGLSITYSIVKEHDGDIIISSEKGKGTKTEIYLPIPDPKKSPFAAEKPQIYKKDGMITTTAGMVLIISDDRNVGKNFSELKGRHPINITFAENEEDAIKKITNEYFHLIICDIDTKAINPGNLYKRTIKIKKNLSDKFIFTGDGELNPNARRFINLTGCPYLQKPLSQKTVRNVFHKLIDIESLQ
ncbi:MAG: response regulator, partial [Candidatus Schekmanbacteria bacterium]